MQGSNEGYGPGGEHEPASPLVRAALRASAEAQVVLDGQARLVLANRRAVERFGLDGSDVGRLVEELDLARLPVDLRPHLEDAAEHAGSLWLHDVAVEETSYDVEVVPFDAGWTVVLHDTTRVRHLQAELGRADRSVASIYEELRRTNDELEQTNEELHEAVEALQACHDRLRRQEEP